MERLEKVTLTQLTVRRDRFISVYRRLLAQHPKKQLNDSKLSFNRIMKQHEQAFRRTLETKSSRFSLAVEKLTLLNPLEVMKRSEEHTSELQSRFDLVCRLL